MKFSIFLFLMLLVSCKNERKAITNHSEGDSIPESFDIGIDRLTLTSLSKDTNEIHIEYGVLSGDYQMFLFKKKPVNRNEKLKEIYCLYIDTKASENSSSPNNYVDSLQVVNYKAFSFKISNKDWDIIKSSADSILNNIDTTKFNEYCETCPSYALGYNNRFIEDKLTKNKQIEKLFKDIYARYHFSIVKSIKKS